MSIPYNARLGFKTIRVLLRKVCELIVKYGPRWTGYLTTEQQEKFDTLMAVCEEVVAIIDAIYEHP